MYILSDMNVTKLLMLKASDGDLMPGLYKKHYTIHVESVHERQNLELYQMD